MTIALYLLSSLFVADELPAKDPRSELSTAIPHFAKLLEDGKCEEFVDTAIYPSRLKDYLKESTKEKLSDAIRERRNELAAGLRAIGELKLTPKAFVPLQDEYEEAVTFTFPNGGKLSFYRRKGLWSGAF